MSAAVGATAHACMQPWQVQRAVGSLHPLYPMMLHACSHVERDYRKPDRRPLGQHGGGVLKAGQMRGGRGRGAQRGRSATAACMHTCTAALSYGTGQAAALADPGCGQVPTASGDGCLRTHACMYAPRACRATPCKRWSVRRLELSCAAPVLCTQRRARLIASHCIALAFHLYSCMLHVVEVARPVGGPNGRRLSVQPLHRVERVWRRQPTHIDQVLAVWCC